jgi:hypothetical protein
MPVSTEQEAWHVAVSDAGICVAVSGGPRPADHDALRSAVQTCEKGRAGVLLDVSPLRADDATADVLRSIARALSDVVPANEGAVAIVGTQLFSYDIARMLETQTASSGVFVRAFADDVSAQTWLRAVLAALSERRFADVPR